MTDHRPMIDRWRNTTGDARCNRRCSACGLRMNDGYLMGKVTLCDACVVALQRFVEAGDRDPFAVGGFDGVQGRTEGR